MLLVDTSVWVEHLRSGDPRLAKALERGEVLVHPFVLGEIALGNLSQRDAVLGALGNLPRPTTATDAEVMSFIDQAGLHGRGIGFVDAHLLASARLTPGSTLWTRDRRLGEAATLLGLAA